MDNQEKLKQLINQSELNPAEKKALADIVPDLDEKTCQKLIQILQEEKETLAKIDQKFQEKLAYLSRHPEALDQKEKIVDNVVREVIKKEDQKDIDKTRKELKDL